MYLSPPYYIERIARKYDIIIMTHSRPRVSVFWEGGTEDFGVWHEILFSFLDNTHDKPVLNLDLYDLETLCVTKIGYRDTTFFKVGSMPMRTLHV